MAVKHGGRGPGYTSRKTTIGSFTGGGEPADVEPPIITSANPSDTYIEGVAIGGTLTADESVTWSKSGTDAARVTLNTSTGVWSLEETDYETKTSYSWTFTATDGASNTTDQVVAITIANDTADDSLAAPVVTLTSAAGDPPEATISNLSTGLYIRIQRTTEAGNYTSPTMDILYGPVDDDDTLNGISNAKLAEYGYTDPTGFWAQRYRYERDDGLVSSWSNEISGTVTASVAEWNATTGVNKSQYVTVSADGLTATVNADTGSNNGVRATVPAATDEFSFEVTIGGIPNRVIVGVVGSTLDLNSGFPNVGMSSNGGAKIQVIPGDSNFVRRHVNNTEDYPSITGDTISVGDKIRVAGNKATNQVSWYWTPSGGSEQLLGTSTITIGVPDQWYAYVAGFNSGDSLTADFTNYG